MRWLLFLLTGCDAVFGLKNVQLPPTDASTADGDSTSVYVATVLGDHPVAYLPLDETGGVIAHDLVAGAPDGAILGEVMVGQPGPFRAAPFAMTFNGIDGAVDLGDVFPFLGTAPFSIECWFSPMTSEAPYYEIVSKWHQAGTDSEAANGWNVFYTSVDDVFVSRETPHNVPDLAQTHFVTSWHHVVGTYDGAKLALYLDGIQLDMAGSTFGLGTIAENLEIGAGNGDAQGVPMLGSIAQVAIYDKALTVPQVAAHFAASTM